MDEFWTVFDVKESVKDGEDAGQEPMGPVELCHRKLVWQ